MAPERKRQLCPKPFLDETLLLEAFREHGISLLHARKLWRAYIQQNVEDWRSIPEIPKTAHLVLQQQFAALTSHVVSRTDAADKSTTKLLIELQDGKKIEAVIMRYGDVDLASFPDQERQKRKTGDGDSLGGRPFHSRKRATLCLSSQVGCTMGCKFCATGTMGLVANLTAGEILEQLVHASRIEKIRNVVFMGMGEPLDNYDAVITAVRAMTDTARSVFCVVLCSYCVWD
jgi:adenine C2-methylase RlmN of 23S rRNA A2503 and tRNA A37